MQTIKLIPAKKNLVVRIYQKEFEISSGPSADVRFEVRTMCDVPILVFRFTQPEDVIVVPVNFRNLATWPEELRIDLQLFDLEKNSVVFEKQISASADDEITILMAKEEQKKMKARQIDAIVDFIYSDYIGFAGLTEVF